MLSFFYTDYYPLTKQATFPMTSRYISIATFVKKSTAFGQAKLKLFRSFRHSVPYLPSYLQQPMLTETSFGCWKNARRNYR